MAKCNFTLKIKIAWWFTYLYLPVIIFLSEFIVNYIDADYEPNFDKIRYWLNKAITTKSA